TARAAVALGAPASSSSPLAMCTTLCQPLTSRPRKVPRWAAPAKSALPRKPSAPAAIRTAPTTAQKPWAGEGPGRVPRGTARAYAENDEGGPLDRLLQSSGGGTRTHNLSVNSRSLLPIELPRNELHRIDRPVAPLSLEKV